MWKRIHSNRDPRDTLYSELQKEFKGYFGAANRLGTKFTDRHPKTLFGLMIILMAASLIISFTIFRHPESVKAAPQKTAINPVKDGFSQIMKATGKIRETLRLKKLVDSISAKKQLSQADSIALDSALTVLQHIHSPNK